MPSRSPWPLIVPFAYVMATRMRSFRAFGYNALMAWVPAFGLLVADGHPWAWAVVDFTLGYLAFIALYELGYLANDVWDARRDPLGRHRLEGVPAPSWIALFVMLRIALFSAIANGTGWWTVPAWAGGFSALVVVFALHNLVAPRLRLLTFPLLAVLRLLLPVAALLSPGMWPSALVIAILPYMAPRWLAYADSKSLLPEGLRRKPRFRSMFLLLLAPLVALGSWWAQSLVPLAALVYYLAVTLAAEPRA